jgi:hypothetical protein
VNHLTTCDALYAANMLRVAAEAATEAGWHDYARYCSLRAEGQRQDAFAAIESFLTHAASWTTLEKRRFVVWVYGVSGHGDFMPFPLLKSLVQPTLQEWHESSPEDPHPLVLMGDVESRWKAYRLAPADPSVAFAFVERATGHLEMSAHELPEYWVGDLEYDRTLSADALLALSACCPGEAVERYSTRLKSIRRELNTWFDKSA